LKNRMASGITLGLLFLIGMLTFNLTIAELDKGKNIEPFGATDVIVTEAVDWWSMFRHDLRHTGYSTSTAPNTNKTLWSYTTGGFVVSSPAVVDGKVYVGSGDDYVYCFGSPLIHDIAVTNVTTSTNVAKTKPDCEPEINVTIVNEGDFIENVTVTVFVNATAIGTQTVYHMLPNSSTIISFSWNTTGFAKGNYTVRAYAVPVLGRN